MKPIRERMSEWLGSRFFNTGDEHRYQEAFWSILQASYGCGAQSAEVDDARWQHFADVAEAMLCTRLRSGAQAPSEALRFVRRKKVPVESVVAATYVSRVDPNTADFATLEELPGLGPQSAAALIAHRNNVALFEDREALYHVEGASPSAIERAMPFLQIEEDPLRTVSQRTGGKRLDIPEALSVIVERASGSVQEPDAAALVLEAMAARARKNPYWEPHRGPSLADLEISALHRKRQERLRESTCCLEGIAPLRNTDYLTVVENLIDLAQDRVWIQLFSLRADAGEAVDELLDRLRTIQDRGVDVRLLHESSEFGEELAEAAAAALKAKGLRFRQDPVGFQSHTKAIIADGQHLVLGTHNWSNGSWFATEEMSYYVQSEELCSRHASRFLSLWEIAAETRSERDFSLNFLESCLPPERAALADAGVRRARDLESAEPLGTAAAIASDRRLSMSRIGELTSIVALMLGLAIPERLAIQLLGAGVTSTEELLSLSNFELRQRLGQQRHQDATWGRIPVDINLVVDVMEAARAIR